MLENWQYWSVIILVFIWTLPWKAMALWRSARRGEKWWFGALLILNTLAILEIVYIFFFSKKSKKKNLSESKDETGDSK